MCNLTGCEHALHCTLPCLLPCLQTTIACHHFAFLAALQDFGSVLIRSTEFHMLCVALLATLQDFEEVASAPLAVFEVTDHMCTLYRLWTFCDQSLCCFAMHATLQDFE
jgi:hypothetical protein